MKRPLSVTLISILYILSGTAGIIYHAPEFVNVFSQADVILVFLLRLSAIVGGVFALRGTNWARWWLMAWILFHLYLSISHETAQLIMHGVISAITAAALFHPGANRFFKRA